MTGIDRGPPPDADRDVVARLAALDSCAVSDALDGLGVEGALLGLGQMWPVPRVVVGRVRTMRVGVRDPEGGPTAHLGTELIQTAAAGDVILVQHDGRTDVSSWGGILSVAARVAGVEAVVVDGACRDVVESEEVGLPIWARAAVPVTARGRIVQRSFDEPVRLCGVEVVSGSYVIGDRSGVVVVPAEVATEAVALAERIARREAEMTADVLRGRSIVDVMHDREFPRPHGDAR